MELNAACIHSLICTRAGSLGRKGQAAVALDRHPAELHIAEEDHSVGSPILNRVGKHIDIHEWAPGLAGSKLTQFSIGLTKTKGRLTRIHTCTKQFELKPCLQIAQRGGIGCLDPKTCLANAKKDVSA